MLLRPKNSMWRDVSPTGAFTDIIAVYKHAGPGRWRYMLASLACTSVLFWLIARDEQRAPPRAPTITYITSWRADRSEEEILRSNKAYQKIKEDRTAEQAKADEEVRKMYETLGRISGMDVDAIKAKAKAEHEAEERANRAAQNAPH